MSDPTGAPRCALCGAVCPEAALDYFDLPDGRSIPVCLACIASARRAAWHVALDSDPGATFTPVRHVGGPGVMRVVAMLPSNDNAWGTPPRAA